MMTTQNSGDSTKSI